MDARADSKEKLRSVAKKIGHLTTFSGALPTGSGANRKLKCVGNVPCKNWLFLEVTK